MEERPLDYSLQKYLEAKEQLEGLEVCITRSRKLLDAIRKDHPDWFNSPSATMTLDRGREITPNELEDIYRTTLERFTALAKRYKALDEPED